MGETKELEQAVVLDQYRALLVQIYRATRDGDDVVIADVLLKPEDGVSDLMEFTLDSWPNPEIPEDSLVQVIDPTVYTRVVGGVIAPDSIEWRAATLVAVAE